MQNSSTDTPTAKEFRQEKSMLTAVIEEAGRGSSSANRALLLLANEKPEFEF